MEKCFAVLFLWTVMTSALRLDLPPRLMWGWSPPDPPTVVGYCGSTSLQTAGIYYGNWLTSDYIRGTSGGHDGKHSLLIGFEKDLPLKSRSIRSACAALKMDCSMWNYNEEKTPQHTRFLQWMQAAIGRGEPVITGLYWGVESNSGYDHIVPVVGFDEEAIYFNDLHSRASTRAELSSFIKSRKHCNSSVLYGSKSFCLPYEIDYGVSVSGNQDSEGSLLPVRLSLSSWTEPDYSKEDKQHQIPTLLTANVTVSKLVPGSRYALLRFEDPRDVPATDFLTANFSQKVEFDADADTFVHETQFMSNSTTLFRCVHVKQEESQAHNDSRPF